MSEKRKMPNDASTPPTKRSSKEDDLDVEVTVISTDDGSVNPSNGKHKSLIVSEDDEAVKKNNRGVCPFAKSETAKDEPDIREFYIINQDDTPSEDINKNYSSEDSEMHTDDIEQLLEESYHRKTASQNSVDETELQLVDGEDSQEQEGNTPNDAENQNEEREKTVLVEKGHNHFEVLPDGWIQVSHNSGIHLYLHKTSRVCTLSKPYHLGPGSARKHQIPLSAIPCLAYQRAIEEEEMEKQKAEERAKSGEAPENAELPSAKIETIVESNKKNSLTHEQVKEYCAKRFIFKTIKVMRFKSWSERRQFSKKRRQQKQIQRPMLPNGTKLITIPIHDSESGFKKEWIMNPTGKSSVCILHEYVQHALQKQPSYHFVELENAATPYQATVVINNTKYGVGYGTSKKSAKLEAARVTLETLIPEMKNENPDGGKKSKDDVDLSFFDEIKIEDPRVTEFCAKTTEPSPHDILLMCLQRNFSLHDYEFVYEGNNACNQKNVFTMKVGKHKVKVVCKNKRDGKQRAAQAILQLIHPHIKSWGSLLRLYGNQSVKSFKEKKMEEQQITNLQSKASINSPNHAILSKLKTEMMKLHSNDTSIVPVGVFMAPEGESLPSFSSSNLDQFFNDIEIEDPRVAEFCAKTTEPCPHDVLMTCLQRNVATAGYDFYNEGVESSNQRNSYIMKAGKHVVRVVCKNKRDAKQRAAQAILQLIHPHIKSWGSILRLYGSQSIKSFKEKKFEEQQITNLQTKASVNSPNHAILSKLKTEMLKLQAQTNSITLEGTFMAPNGESLPNFSSSNLDQVDL